MTLNPKNFISKADYEEAEERLLQQAENDKKNASFLLEVERRAGDLEMIRAMLRSQSFTSGEREEFYADWLRCILGEKP